MTTRILIVEDNAINQKVARLMLGQSGYDNIDVVADGDEAVQACTIHEYDLILMDCQMPRMNGLEASQKIRMLPKPQPVIIALTAHCFEHNRRECLDSGMNDYLAKPYSRRQLLDKIKAHVI